MYNSGSASKSAGQLRWVPQVWKIQLLGCATNIPAGETKGIHPAFTLPPFSMGEGFPEVGENLSLGQRDFLSVLGG